MKLLFLLFISVSTSFLTAQSTYHVHIAGSINPVFTNDLQIEIPLNEITSFGFKLRNYRRAIDISMGNTGYSIVSSEPKFFLFKGNILEAFGRRYFNRLKTTKSHLWFGQAKFGFGNYQNPLFTHEANEFTDQNYVNQTFMTFGGGIGVGRKIIIRKYLTFELYAGLRFYTPPKYVRVEEFDELNYNNAEEFVRNMWFITRSFPIEFGWKFGFQI